MARISRERAERIAKGHACVQCQEYTFRKIAVRPALKSVQDEVGVAWLVTRTCGVCGHQGEIGIEADGNIAFEG